MNGLDSNILIRYVVDDDAKQGAIVERLLGDRSLGPWFVNAVVLAEFAWVLGQTYRYSSEQIADAIQAILETDGFTVEHSEEAWIALELFRQSKAGFADCLIGVRNQAKGCAETFTFDRDAAALPVFVRAG